MVAFLDSAECPTGLRRQLARASLAVAWLGFVDMARTWRPGNWRRALQSFRTSLRCTCMTSGRLAWGVMTMLAVALRLTRHGPADWTRLAPAPRPTVASSCHLLLTLRSQPLADAPIHPRLHKATGCRVDGEGFVSRSRTLHCAAGAEGKKKIDRDSTPSHRRGSAQLNAPILWLKPHQTLSTYPSRGPPVAQPYAARDLGG